MDRDAIMGAMPGDAEFRAAPEYRKKEIVEALIDAILDALDEEGREPDRWEAEHIGYAFGLILSDWYHAAYAKAYLTFTPPNERATPEKWARAADTPNVNSLRQALIYVAGKPARNI